MYIPPAKNNSYRFITLEEISNSKEYKDHSRYVSESVIKKVKKNWFCRDLNEITGVTNYVLPTGVKSRSYCVVERYNRDDIVVKMKFEELVDLLNKKGDELKIGY